MKNKLFIDEKIRDVRMIFGSGVMGASTVITADPNESGVPSIEPHVMRGSTSTPGSGAGVAMSCCSEESGMEEEEEGSFSVEGLEESSIREE